MNSPPSASRQRLFVALWPPAPLAHCLADVAASLHTACGARAVPREHLHITVVFLGSVDSTRLGEVQQVMRASAGESFELALDAITYRRRGGMLWARATQSPAPLQALVQRLRTAFTASDFAVEDRAFIAHLTLLRDARKPAQLPLLATTPWRVDELTLVRSNLHHHGARYEIIFRQPLSG